MCAEVAAQSRQEKLHAAVARSTFASQNVKKLTVLEHFWKSTCPKMARGCSEKHICKSKCTKHLSAEDFLEVWVWKIGTPLWREAHLQVKMSKTWRFGPLFEVRMSKNCRKMARRCGAKHIYKSKCKKHLRFAPLLEVSN